MKKRNKSENNIYNYPKRIANFKKENKKSKSLDIKLKYLNHENIIDKNKIIEINKYQKRGPDKYIKGNKMELYKGLNNINKIKNVGDIKISENMENDKNKNILIKNELNNENFSSLLCGDFNQNKNESEEKSNNNFLKFNVKNIMENNQKLSEKENKLFTELLNNNYEEYDYNDSDFFSDNDIYDLALEEEEE